MKLSYVASNVTTVAQQTLSMQWFNTKRVMVKLFKTVTTLMVGISIPSVVFEIVDKMFNANFLSNQAVTNAMSAYIGSGVMEMSISLVYELGYLVSIVCMLATIFKFMQNGDFKQFGKDVVCLVVGFAMITFTKLIPVVLPALLRFVGIL